MVLVFVKELGKIGAMQILGRSFRRCPMKAAPPTTSAEHTLQLRQATGPIPTLDIVALATYSLSRTMSIVKGKRQAREIDQFTSRVLI